MSQASPSQGPSAQNELANAELAALLDYLDTVAIALPAPVTEPGDLQPLADPVPVQTLTAELAALPDDQLLHTFRQWKVYFASQAQAPAILHEITRLRELTFREMQEGSGLAVDTDEFDATYDHLFVWDTEAQTIVGGYRLGHADDVHHYAIDVGGPETAPMTDRAKYIDVRSAASGCGPEDCNVLATARSLIDWHARHGFCAVCGQPTRMREGGYARKCTSESCGAEHFPRTDPVTIMLVVDGDDRCLLGRQARFPKGNYSALAGFMEPGEAIEDAVRREVFEEAGIVVGEVRYHSSQPWPFPSSLMIGCICEATTTEIALDQDELEDARWFDRESVKAGLAGQGPGSLFLPPSFAVAHHLARAWAEGE